MYWPQFTLPPTPSKAVGVTPYLRRMYTGSKSLSGFVEEAQINYETKRQLSQAAFLLQLTGSIATGIMHTWHTPSGRVSIIPEFDCAADGYAEPISFELHKTRPYDTPGTKANLIVHANADPQLAWPGMPFHRLVTIQYKHPRLISLTNYRIIEEMLKCQIAPFIGILDSNTNLVNFYTLHYDPPTEDYPRGMLRPHLLIEGRSPRYSMNLPHMTSKIIKGKLRWIPNYAMLYLFKAVLIDPTPNIEMYNYRRIYIDNYILKMTFHSTSWVELFKEAEIDLTQREIEIIESKTPQIEEDE
jgi:hypothetical protein